MTRHQEWLRTVWFRLTVITTSILAMAAASVLAGGPARAATVLDPLSPDAIKADLLRAQKGHGLGLSAGAKELPPGTIHSDGMRTPSTIGHGVYTWSEAITVDGVTTLSGNAHGLSARKAYVLTGLIYVDHKLAGHVGPVNITLSTSGSLPDYAVCYPKGHQVDYVVGLGAGNGVDVIETSTSTTWT
jgi:hypothetical protein